MILNGVFKNFGFQVKKFKKANYGWLKKFPIKTIIDIGANQGQFAIEYTKILPGAKILSFEPVSECYQQLLKNTKHLNVDCFNFGLGDSNIDSEINVYNHSPSSSLLEMERLHEELYPFSKGVIAEKILLKRLDDVINLDKIEKDIFLKIDVQGYEDKVLNGGKKILENTKIILIETSYCELYKNQPLFNDIYNILVGFGFSFAGNLSQTFNQNDGSIVYSDSIFIKL